MVSGTFSIPLGLIGETDAAPRIRQALSGLGSSLGLREFIAGEENQLVRVLLPTLERAEHSFHPLLLCGPTGAGKTMLACGLAQRYKELHPAAKTLIITGADFARAYATAVETAGVADFRKKFLSLSLVVLDDIQHLAQKPGAQQEWRHLLDALADRDVLVIVTSRHAPGELVEFTPDLRSRLSAGLVVPLAWPAIDTRREMIARFFAARRQVLPEPCIERLATQVSGPPSRLFAMLSQLLHTASVDQRVLDLTLINELLAEQATAHEPTARMIIAAVAKQYRLKVSELRGSSRRQTIADARGVAMLLLRELTKQSYREIGKHFADRDHTTVLHACQKTLSHLATDVALQQTVQDLKSTLTEG
ncbi:MAG TPA: DnaA/Hda family protein [Pirellulaceae bacterium]|nr:DnaA/Hda family protein [Pirellulaceae bacterium]